MSESETNLDKQVFKGNIRPPRSEDISSLGRILQTWVRDSKTRELIPAEIASILKAVDESVREPRDVRYLVAEDQGKILGMMGYRSPNDPRMLQFAQTDKPAEIINAFVEAGNRAGRGVGSALIKTLELDAAINGFKEILVNSGGRYKDTAWDFYSRKLGQPVGVIENMYGSGNNAPVWRKSLSTR